MAFPFAERRNAVVGRCLDAVVRRPARAGARAGGPDLSRLVVGRRERWRRRRAVRPANSPGPAQGTAFMWLDCAVRPGDYTDGGPFGAAHLFRWRRHGEHRPARRGGWPHGVRLAARAPGPASAGQLRDAGERGGVDRGLDRVAQGRDPAEAAGALHERGRGGRRGSREPAVAPLGPRVARPRTSDLVPRAGAAPTAAPPD